MSADDLLKLDNQFCFSLYRLSKLVTSNYKTFLDKFDLTYPQYLVMMVLWEQKKVNMSTLGSLLSLDNGTLTPLIKRLIEKGFVNKKRCLEDERIVYIETTKCGEKLKEEAIEIPAKLLCSNGIDLKKLNELKIEIDQLYNNWRKNE